MSHTVHVDEMGAQFRAHLRAMGGDEDEPDAEKAWLAFHAFAHTPVELGGLAPGMTEDFLMFDHSHGGGSRAVLRLVRTIGLADADGDHIESRPFECYLFYDDSPDIDALPTGALWASSPPGQPLSRVDAFVSEVEASDVFRVLVGERRPVRMEITP